ncbi:MAG: M55 family metallopeptidase [Chloroflexi bacterium]|nr:M55 family metallopeptidase [Chloroflexota bacterium]
MKLLIVDDMEGATGVIDWSQVMDDQPDYQRFRKVLTGDVNAAIRGACKGGADEIVVSDGHNYARNLLIEELDPRANLNYGSPSSLSMVEGVDKNVDAIMFIAYHARAGTLKAVLCHTWSLNTTNVWINGRITGEFGLNSSVAGSFGVPPLLLTGDRAVCQEALEWVPDLETVCVKTASGRYAAECLPPEKTQVMIEEAACKAVQRFLKGQAPKPIVVDTPVVIRVEFTTPNQADSACILPNTTRVDGRTLDITAPDMVTAYNSFRAVASLGR